MNPCVIIRKSKHLSGAGWPAHGSAQAIMTKHLKPGSLKNGRLAPPSSGGGSQGQGVSRAASPEASLRSLQTADFSLCLRVALPLCAWVSASTSEDTLPDDLTNVSCARTRPPNEAHSEVGVRTSTRGPGGTQLSPHQPGPSCLASRDTWRWSGGLPVQNLVFTEIDPDPG